MRKIIVTVAPVCHVGKDIPAECKNPLTPEEIAEDTINCYKAGACEVHLHTRDLQGNPTFELDVFRQTIGLIRKETDMIVQGVYGWTLHADAGRALCVVGRPRGGGCFAEYGQCEFWRDCIYQHDA